MYTVKCFAKTGYNAVNIPDGPEVFDTLTPVLTQDILINQDTGLPYIDVKATWNVIADVDYCIIGTRCYVANTPSMLSVDVARIPLIYDAVTSNGGPAKITFLDGITERHTTSDDDMFKYSEPDAYTTPSSPLIMDNAEMMQFETPGSNDFVVVESTIDLESFGAQFTENSDGTFTFSGTGIPFTDSFGNVVTVPYAQATENVTTYQIGTDENGVVVSSPNTTQYSASASAIKKALGAVQALSIESGLISEVRYPANYVGIANHETDETSSGRLIKLTGQNALLTASGVPYKSTKYGTIHNNRVFYGEFNKFGLLSASGDRGEFLPEQIHGSDDGSGAPQIRAIADPRPTGKPYFRFTNYLTYTSGSISDFMVSSIAGLPWANAPLTYQGASGSYLNRLQFDNSRVRENLSYNQANQRRTFNYAAGEVRNIAGLIGNIANASNVGGVIGTIAGTVVDAAINASEYTMLSGQASDAYHIQASQEAQQFGIAQTVVAPQIVFPFSADIFRDFVGNNVIVYKYGYTETDAQRIDKLLTMYGYKVTEKLSASMFSARTYFDYVRASGVSVGGDIPMWEKNAIASQLNAGVRVWHVTPDEKYYSDGNPIKETTT